MRGRALISSKWTWSLDQKKLNGGYGQDGTIVEAIRIKESWRGRKGTLSERGAVQRYESR